MPWSGLIQALSFSTMHLFNISTSLKNNTIATLQFTSCLLNCCRFISRYITLICIHYRPTVGDKTDPIPLMWSAPESLLESVFSYKSMVYLAARTAIEVLSHGVHPFQEIEGSTQDTVMLVLASHAL